MHSKTVRRLNGSFLLKISGSKEKLTKAAGKELEKEVIDKAFINLNNIEGVLISKKAENEEKIL